MLAPILDPHHGTPGIPSGKRDQEILGIELAARSEPTANVVFDQVDRGFREAHHLSNGAAVEERHLCRAHDR